jgi:hypothetical protein
MRLSVLPLVAVAACAALPEAKTEIAPSGQTFPDAVAKICDVDRLARLGDDDSLELGLERSAWITEHVDHPEAIEIRVLLSVKGAGEQAEMLRAQARKVGLRSCALADSLEQRGTGGLSP